MNFSSKPYYPPAQRSEPTFTTITLKTGSGWTEGAAVCSICSAVVLDRDAHRDWHAQCVMAAPDYDQRGELA